MFSAPLDKYQRVQSLDCMVKVYLILWETARTVFRVAVLSVSSEVIICVASHPHQRLVVFDHSNRCCIFVFICISLWCEASFYILVTIRVSPLMKYLFVLWLVYCWYIGEQLTLDISFVFFNLALMFLFPGLVSSVSPRCSSWWSCHLKTQVMLCVSSQSVCCIPFLAGFRKKIRYDLVKEWWEDSRAFRLI